MEISKAEELINKFSSVENALICVETILEDLEESFELSKSLHPHAEGLIAGSIAVWQSIRRELKNIDNEKH